METFDIDHPNKKPAWKNTYHVAKKIFWPVVFVLTIVFIVLLVLTIYFGVNQKSKNGINNKASTTLITTTSQLQTITSHEVTTTITPLPPVERIPNNLQQLFYQLTIAPDLVNERFTGDLLYTFICVEATNQMILHMKDLFIENSTVRIVNSSSSSMPTFLSWSYDDYNEFMILNFSSIFIAGTTYTIRIVYEGDITHDLHGLYISDYVDVNEKNRIFMTSQMEPIYARSVIPCIDEPSRKAIFKISVLHDSSYAVWSNGEIERIETFGDGRTLSHFTPTLKMSTFLLALIMAPISDFACRPDRLIGSKNTKSRVCGRVDILPQLVYADEVAYKALEFFNTYFDIDYPLPKIEHFAVPDFGAGAMENYGLLIYRELSLFFDEKTVSASRKQYITTVVSHEIAHQWFGNLVSPAWWGELWLKEGFANYMETLASDFVEPSWLQEEQFVVEKIFRFMVADSLPTSRPISIQSTNPADIFQLFDLITYDKGATLIRMMSMFLGADTFQRGVRTYLKALSFSSATQNDLWAYLSEAANNTIDVERIMDGWTRQAGYPIVEVNRVYNASNRQSVGGRMTISQRPFSFFSTTTKSDKWWIPFKYFDQTSTQLPNGNEIVWLNDTSATILIATSDSDWVLTNPGYLSIYRTKYDPQNFRLIVAQLQTDHTRIPVITRGALIDDTFALSRTGLINATDAYQLIQYMKSETEYVPWTAALSAMSQQTELLANHDILLDVERYFLELVLPIYNTIGWIPIDQSTEWLRTLLQPSIVSAACRYGHQGCIEAARSVYRRWNLNPTLNQIPADVRSIVYCTVVREGSQSEFNFLWARLQRELIASETFNLLKGLSCTQDPSLILWFLEQHLKNGSAIRDQDLSMSIENVARSPRGNQIAWNWIRDNWSQLFDKWGKSESTLGDIIEAVSSRFVSVRQRDEFKTFADSIIDKGNAYRQFQLSIDSINAAIEWNKANLASIITFFRSNNESSIVSYRLPTDVVPIHYDLYVKPYMNITNENLRFSMFDGRVRIHLNVTRTTDRIVLHKRFIIIREPIEITGGASVIKTTFNQDQDYFTIILDQSLQVNEQPILTLNYVGELRNDTDGFYVSSYVRSSDNVRRYLVASQMAPISARRALPCFDEPALKATFAVTVEHEQQYRAWSNMPVQNRTNQSNGWVLTQFQTSVSMSSYLLALVIADFECLTRNDTGRFGNITTSVCAQAEKKDDLIYALEVAAQNIREFEEQYDVNYPLPKCDHIAVPDFDAGAMENFGCIMYRETLLLYNNRTSSSFNKQSVALVIVHELAHQWFGNLVSPLWWDDLWLNEGFAKWMEFVGTNKIHPEWNLLQQFIAQRWLTVMQDDAVSFSHPVNMQITRNEQLASIFDAITYSKGSSLLRMMRNFMPNDTFNKGITRYLSRHLYSTAMQNDLWRALGEQMFADNLELPSNTSLDMIMSTWTNQMGYPYVQVTRDYATGGVTVAQHQFLFDSEAQPPKSPHQYLWYIPLQFKSSSTLSASTIWFNRPHMNVTTGTSVQSNEWLLANPDLLGFFRTNYDAHNWKMIIEQLKNDHEKLTVIERAGLIDDVFNLARANIVQTSLVFDLLNYANAERAYIVWERILAGLSYVEQMIASSSSDLMLYEQFQSYMIDLILPIYFHLGWQEKSSTVSDEWLVALHRDLIVSAACRYNLDDCVHRAQILFEQWFNHPSNNPIEPNDRPVVYCTNVRIGGRAEFQFLLHQYQISNDPQEKARIQSALACTRDTESIRYLLEIHVNLQLNIIRRQDALSGIRTICQKLFVEIECWAFVRSRWIQLFQDFGKSMSFINVIKDVTARFNTEHQLDEFERFVEQTTHNSAVEFQAIIERIRANIQWIEKAKPNLEEWFMNRTIEIRLPLDWIPSNYALDFDVRLSAIYPNNVEPDTRFMGRTHIIVRCNRSTNVFRIHMKQLKMSSITLRRLDASNNLITGWAWMPVSETLICQLRERCVTNKEYVFESEHTAELNRDMVGFYLSRYNVTNTTTGEIITHNIAGTHMQPTLARNVFPCFDEPAFKAKFNISITHDPSFTVVRSNGGMLNGSQPIQQPNGRLLSSFEETPPMSTYLIAFVVTDFECVSSVTSTNIEVNVCGRPEAIRKGEGNFALQVSTEIIPYYEQSYNISYPLTKCDHFALPDFAIGGMENWGLITYRETALLYNNVTGNLADKRRVGEVVAHELAHQWFGDIVTPQWWNDIWLNEGFASWVEVLGLNHSNPEFHSFDVFVSVVVHRALEMDSLYSSHPISVEVTHPDEINSIFDAISYDKGASVLRMIYTVLNESTFFRGISNYLNHFQYSNAVQDQLWTFLTDAASSSVLEGHTVKTIMDTWTLQEGYPLLTVTRSNIDNSISLSQKRYLLDPRTSNQTSIYVNPFTFFPFQWYIPFNYMTSMGSSSFNWLAPNQTRVLSNVSLATDWIVFNVDEFGFYRVNYDEFNWQLLINGLKTDRTSFSSVTRAQLIDDSFNLARSGDLNVTVALQLSTYLANETEYVPYSAFSNNIQYPLAMFSQQDGNNMYQNMQKFIQILEEARYDSFGWSVGMDPQPLDYLTTQLRALIIRDLCANEYAMCINDAAEKYRQWRTDPDAYPIAPDSRTVAYCQGIRSGTTDDYEHMRELYKRTNDQVEKNRFGYSLTCTKNAILLEQLLNTTLANEYIRLQDASRFINNIRLQPGGQKLTWRFISQQWSELVAKFGSVSFTLSDIVENVLEYVNTQQELDTILQFMANTVDLSIAERAFLSSIEKIRANIRWMDTVGQDIGVWLDGHLETVLKNKPYSEFAYEPPVNKK
ncbi:unnamed protein product [Rotaria socialis]|uniref:Uncharacterized protein n=1 Tax=Rotaria socialis TaxID=392032 RepID=A0A818DIL6_9BILA|nr:unnamed protein product [Rotaria socialis]